MILAVMPEGRLCVRDDALNALRTPHGIHLELLIADSYERNLS